MEPFDRNLQFTDKNDMIGGEWNLNNEKVLHGIKTDETNLFDIVHDLRKQKCLDSFVGVGDVEQEMNLLGFCVFLDKFLHFG